MILLDLYCGAGGAAMGYHQAGFEVVGVDIEKQPNYPFTFIQSDAIHFALKYSDEFDVIHASPPCQGYSTSVRSTDSQYSRSRGKAEPKLIDITRQFIDHKPYIIENVMGAKEELINPLQICGIPLGLNIARHRLIESNVPLVMPPHEPHVGYMKKYAAEHGIDYRDMSVTGKGRRAGTSDRWKELLGITWHMSQTELSVALPPVYTEYIGKQIIERMQDESQ